MRIFKSTKGRLIILLMFLLPLIDFIQHIYNDIILLGSFDPENHPAFTSFLSGSTMGHFTQILLSFILPLYFLLLYADSYTTDRNSGYLKCLIMRVGKKEYYKTKFKIAAIVPSVIMFFSLLLNFLLCIFFFHSGSSFGGMEEYYHDMNKWFIFGYNHPYIYYFIYIITYCFVCGLCSVLGLCFSIIFRNHYIAYPVSFFVWIIQAIFPYGVGNSIQPFTEYGFNHYLSGLIIFSATVLMVFIVTYFMGLRNKDEI